MATMVNCCWVCVIFVHRIRSKGVSGMIMIELSLIALAYAGFIIACHNVNS